MSLLSTPAILLRAHPYSETSQILRFMTEDHGVQAMMAKGVRKRGGKSGGSLATFAQGTLTFYFRDHRDLQTFKDFAPSHPRRGLASHPSRLGSASALGELLLQHAGSDPNPGLFQCLSSGLDRLETEALDSLLPRLLAELWSTIREMGYGPVLHHCVECGRELNQEEMARFDFASGGLRCGTCQAGAHGPRIGPGARIQLQAFLDGEIPGSLQRSRAHLRLVSDFITYHISGGAPLRSFQVLHSLISDSNA